MPHHDARRLEADLARRRLATLDRATGIARAVEIALVAHLEAIGREPTRLDDEDEGVGRAWDFRGFDDEGDVQRDERHRVRSVRPAAGLA
jgi:hypothetical protein